ncbi:IS4 family transposase, partial [Dysgonomonas sp. 511]|nr:IS4 family transposase [Dysgonomonas sp. 511]
MHNGHYVFTQLCSFLPKRVFDCLVDKYEGNKYVKSFTCWNHLLVLIFGQLSNRESLRDLIGILDAHKNKFYHLGFGKSVTRSNLSKANEVRSIDVFERFSLRLVDYIKSNNTQFVDLETDDKVYAFDSSIITLCINTFWWAKQRKGTGGIKLHTLYDIKNQIPTFNVITDQLTSDCTLMDIIPYEPNAFYLFDKAYISTPQLYAINLIGAFFVVRKKQNMKYNVLIDKNYNNIQTGIMADQIIKFTSRIAQKGYPGKLRSVVYYSKEQKTTFSFLTNNLDITAEQVATLYKYRWNIEIFFKWIKQHLRIKEFYGTSENAVKIQIFSAIITYCLVVIMKHELKIKGSTYEILRVLSLSLFEKIPIENLFNDQQTQVKYQNDTQLSLNFF